MQQTRTNYAPKPRRSFGELDIDAYEIEIERLRREHQSKINEPTTLGKPTQLRGNVKDTIMLPRYQAAYGAVCNPWLDDRVSGIRYAPLLDWIALQPELTARDKKFHAALLYRARMCRDWLRTDKLIETTGNSRWRVNDYIRKFKEYGLIKSRFKGVFLLVKPGSGRVDLPLDKAVMSVSEYNDLHKSRIPESLMTYKEISDQAVILYGRLCGRAGKEGWWFGTYETLASDCGCHHDTIRRAVHELEREALIKVDRENRQRSGYRRGPGASRFYFLGHRLFRLKAEPMNDKTNRP